MIKYPKKVIIKNLKKTQITMKRGMDYQKKFCIVKNV